MKCGMQILFSILSSALTIIVFYLSSIFLIEEIKHDLWLIIIAIIIVLTVLGLNLIFGYYFANKMLKKGFIVQFAILFIISVFIVCFENTYIYYVGIFLNPIYIYIKFIIWYFNAALSDSLFLKSVLSILSAALPSIFMYSGFKIASK